MNAIRSLLQRPIAYQPVIAKATGSIKLTVLWCQIHYWTDKTQDPEGWVYKTCKDVFEETGLGRKEQETARELGEKMGILETKLKGSPPIMHYRVDLDRMVEVIERYTAKEEPKPDKPKKTKGTNTIAYLREMPEADVSEMASRMKVSTKCVRERAQDVIDYCEAKGKKYADYKAALRNFIKSHVERHPDAIIRTADTFTPSNEAPIERTEMTPEQRAASNKKLDEMRAELARKKSMR